MVEISATYNPYLTGQTSSAYNSQDFDNVFSGIDAILQNQEITNKESAITEYLKKERIARSTEVDPTSTGNKKDVPNNLYEQARLDNAVTNFLNKKHPEANINIQNVLDNSIPGQNDSIRNDFFTKSATEREKLQNSQYVKQYSYHTDISDWQITGATKPVSSPELPKKDAAPKHSDTPPAPDITKIQADLKDPNSDLSKSLQGAMSANETKGMVSGFKNAETPKLFAALDKEYESQKSTYKNDNESDAEARMRFYNKRLPEMLKDATAMVVPTYAKDGDRIKAVFVNKKGSGDAESFTRELEGKIFINSKGKFEDENGNELKVKNGKVTVDDKEYNVKDIEPAQVDYKIYITKPDSKLSVASAATKGEKSFIEQSKLVAQAKGDTEELDKLKEATVVIDKTEKAVKEREKEDKESGMKTAAVVVGIISALTGLAVALCGGRNGSYMSGGCSGYGGYGNGCQGGPAVWSDKYGYARGLTVPYAYNRSNQYLSTIYNNPVKTRASIMRHNGMNAIHAGVGTTLTS